MFQRSLTQPSRFQRKTALVVALLWGVLLCAPAYFLTLPCAACTASAHLAAAHLQLREEAALSTPQNALLDCPMPCCRVSVSTAAPHAASVYFLKSTHAARVHQLFNNHCSLNAICPAAAVVSHKSSPACASVEVWLTGTTPQPRSVLGSLAVRGPPDSSASRLADVSPHRSSGLSPPLV